MNRNILKLILCNYNDVYILVRGNNITLNHEITRVAFKNCAPFTNCITKLDGIVIDDAEDLDLIMPIYSLI